MGSQSSGLTARRSSRGHKRTAALPIEGPLERVVGLGRRVGDPRPCGPFRTAIVAIPHTCRWITVLTNPMQSRSVVPAREMPPDMPRIAGRRPRLRAPARRVVDVRRVQPGTRIALFDEK